MNHDDGTAGVRLNLGCLLDLAKQAPAWSLSDRDSDTVFKVAGRAGRVFAESRLVLG
jgi:hypothetical protein